MHEITSFYKTLVIRTSNMYIFSSAGIIWSCPGTGHGYDVSQRIQRSMVQIYVSICAAVLLHYTYQVCTRHSVHRFWSCMC